MIKAIYLLFLLTFIISAIGLCPQTSQNDLLQSGSYFFYNNNAGTSIRQHLYIFPIGFTPPNGNLQVVASSSNIQLSSGVDVDFQILGSIGPSSAFGAVILLINEDSSWTSVQVYYLASARIDFFLGTFSAGIYLQQKYAAGDSISIVYSIPDWKKNSASFTALAQISGIKTSADSYSVTIGTIRFVGGQIICQIVLNSTLPIQNIVLSYIVFQSSSPFVFSSFTYPKGSNATYQFIGTGHINNGVSSYYGYGFASKAPTRNDIECIGGNCPSSCLSPQNCQKSRGQVLESTCFLCRNGQVVQNATCISFNQNCGPNQFFNGTGCTCFMGYLMVESACYPGCGLNAYIINSECLCLPGYSYSQVANNCIQQSTPKCQKNYIIVNNTCICQGQFGLINNLCVKCPSNGYRSTDNKCVCNAGYSLDLATFTCIADCMPNSYRNIFGQCVCNNGYYNTGKDCIIVSSCSNGQIWSGTACVCPQGQVPDSITQQCTYCNTPDRMVSINQCVCSPYYYPTKIGCSMCPENSLYNITSKICQCINGYTMQDGVCGLSVKCPLNSVWNTLTLKCDCTDFEEYVINGFCQPCSLNSKWNGTACECNPGFISNGSLCNCPLKSSWIGFGCVCEAGYIMVGNNCTQCDSNAIYLPAQKSCVCKSGWFGTFNKCLPCSSQCATCLGGSSNQCVSCTETKKLLNGQCVPTSCQDGQYLSNNTCQNCPTNCSKCSASNYCTACNSGFSLNTSNINGSQIISCQPASANYILSLKGQVISNGVVYQGISLNLMPNLILADGCTICDKLLTVQISSSFIKVTTSIQYITNSQYWFLITFNLGAVSFTPYFQFTIQFNPTYSSYFSVTDMQQQLKGSVGTNTFAATNPNLQPKFTSNSQTGPVKKLRGNLQQTTAFTSDGKSSSIEIPASTIASLFA